LQYTSRESETGVLAAVTEHGWSKDMAVLQGPGTDSGTLGKCEVVSYTRGYAKRSYTLRSRGRSLAIIPETWFPGWRMFLDGKPVNILCVDWFLIGAFVPDGEHKLEVKYDPQSFRIGLWISCMAAVVLAFVLLFCADPKQENLTRRVV